MMLPSGWGARLLGSASSLEEMRFFTALEEGVPEGSLMLARLDFEEAVPAETVTEIGRRCLESGVPPWPRAAEVASPDPTGHSIWLAWQKGIAWWGVILGILGATLLPPLLGGLVWVVTPEPVRQMIEMMVMMGFMAFAMFGMTMLMRPLMAPKKEEE